MIEWVRNKFILLGVKNDKMQHAISGFLLGFIGALLVSWWFVLIVCIGISFGFEYWQKYTKRGVFDACDATFTVTGSVVGCIIGSIL